MDEPPSTPFNINSDDDNSILPILESHEIKTDPSVKTEFPIEAKIPIETESSDVAPTLSSETQNDETSSSFLHQFFATLDDDSEKVKCKVKSCDASYAKTANTTAWLIKHLQTKHKSLYQKAVQHKFLNSSPQNNNTAGPSSKTSEQDVFSTNFTFDKSKLTSKTKNLTVTFNQHRLQVPLFLVDSFNLVCLHIKTEGLFQMPFNSERVKVTRYAFFGDFGLPQYFSIFDVCGSIQYFLRQFNQPIINKSMEDVYKKSLAKNGDKFEALISMLNVASGFFRAILLYVGVKLRMILDSADFNQTSYGSIAEFFLKAFFRNLKRMNVSEKDFKMSIIVALIANVKLILLKNPSEVFSTSRKSQAPSAFQNLSSKPAMLEGPENLKRIKRRVSLPPIHDRIKAIYLEGIKKTALHESRDTNVPLKRFKPDLLPVENDLNLTAPILVNNLNHPVIDKENELINDYLAENLNNEQSLKCKLCSKEFNFAFELIQHTRHVHPVVVDGMRHICNLCPFVTMNEVLMKAHIRSALHQQKHRNNRSENIDGLTEVKVLDKNESKSGISMNGSEDENIFLLENDNVNNIDI